MMRKACVRHIAKSFKPGEFVEFGAGTGDFTAMFLDLGYKGVCYDLTDETRQLLRENLKEYGDKLTVIDTLDFIEGREFDYLFAFEVLEHVEDDLGVLSEWTEYLRPGGKALISVPAHQKKFTKDDKFHGHVRRYEKSALFELFRGAGYDDIRILNYGFPLGNLTRRVNSLMFGFLSGKDKETMELSQEERSIKSGVERLDKSVRLSFLFNHFFMFPFLVLQRLFYKADIGDGYVVSAVKKAR
jgi:SAM-dependent methyltransferase